jgi:hemoglobin
MSIALDVGGHAVELFSVVLEEVMGSYAPSSRVQRRPVQAVAPSTVRDPIACETRRPAMPPPEQPSLYDRLGGVYHIATVVDDFIDRIMLDPRLNANPRVNEAHHRVSPAGFKYLVTKMVCWATGGLQQYSGRPMGDSHRHLLITPEEWQAFMDDFQQTLEKFHVPQPEQGELKAIVESTRDAIVVAPT